MWLSMWKVMLNSKFLLVCDGEELLVIKRQAASGVNAGEAFVPGKRQIPRFPAGNGKKTFLLRRVHLH